MKIKLLFIMTLIVSSSIYSQDVNYTIEGKVNFESQGTIYLYLVDSETFKIPGDNIMIQEIIPSPEDIENGFVLFKFTDVEPGTYGIRCFQDEDGDKKLKMGVFGPKEPYCMSWEKKPFGKPKFKHIPESVQIINISHIFQDPDYKKPRFA